MFLKYLEEKIKSIYLILAEIEGVIKGFNANIINEESGACSKEQELKKLKYGEGSLRQRQRLNKNGSVYRYYEARYVDVCGTQKSVNGVTQEICLKRLKEAQKNNKRLRLNAIPPKREETFGDWINFWYENYRKINISPKTAESYETCIRKHISEELKAKNMEQLSTSDIMKDLANNQNLRQRKISSQLIIASLKQAYAERKINSQIWIGIVVKNKKAKEKAILTYEQEKVLLSKLDAELRAAVIGYIWTGCRPSELLNIKEKHINRIDKILTIPGTKTEKAYRTMPLYPEAEKVLPLDGEIKLQSLQRALKNISEEILGEPINLYTLRHTFATRCYEKGISLKLIQKWLGHSSIKVTGDIYTHNSSILEKEEAIKLTK